MKFKWYELYEEIAQLGVILYNYFEPEDPRFRLVENLIKSKASIRDGKSKWEIFEGLRRELEMDNHELSKELFGILLSMDSKINSSSRVIHESVLGFEMPVTGSLILQRKNLRRFLLIKPRYRALVKNEELLYSNAYPKIFPGIFFHVSQKLVKLDSVEHLLLYYVKKVKDIEK